MSRNWPERPDGWGARLAARTRDTVCETVARHGLRLDISNIPHLEFSCSVPVQPGLDFELWFNLAGDEVTFGGENWYADIFPADDDENFAIVMTAFDGLITGNSRVLLYNALGRQRPYWSVVQTYRDGKWINVSTGAGCAIPPVIRPATLRNGYAFDLGFPRPAWGSTALLLALGAAIVWLFR